MKTSIALFITGLIFTLIPASVFSQPIPAEFIAGNNYSTIGLIVNKKFSETSKFGIFHLNKLDIYYNDKEKNDLILQDLLFYEPIKSFRITGGAFYGGHGFSPTAGFQYVKKYKSLFILIAPRINIEHDPAYDMMSIIQYTPKLSEKMNLYTSLKYLKVFDSGGNIKSNPEFKLGLEKGNYQFGFSVALNRQCPYPENEYNFGVFVVREIF